MKLTLIYKIMSLPFLTYNVYSISVSAYKTEGSISLGENISKTELKNILSDMSKEKFKGHYGTIRAIFITRKEASNDNGDMSLSYYGESSLIDATEKIQSLTLR